MSTRVDAPRLVAAVERACERALSADDLFGEVSTEVQKAVPFDGAMWFGVDPVTMLATAPARVEHLDGGYCHTFWHGEFHEQDAVLFRDLARQDEPAASLLGATGDAPSRSPRYREFMHPQNYIDELRVAFRSGDRTWGIAGLYREKGRQPFTPNDVSLVAAVSGIVADAVRVRVARDAAAVLSVAPGLLVFDGAGVLVSANGEAAEWLDEIYGYGATPGEWLDFLATPGHSDIELPVPIIPLLAHARAVRAGRERGPARLRVRDRNGRWLVLHASCLEGAPGSEQVAVVVEPAKSAEVAPILIEAYGLSPRERDVVRCIAQGLSTPAIAETMYLSAHTVRDYIKSIFEKVGVTSRGELVAKFFAEHYWDPMHEALFDIE